MTVSWTELYDRLCKCSEGAFDYIEQHLNLSGEFIKAKMAPTRARTIVNLLKDRRDDKLKLSLLQLLNKVQSVAEDYLGGRLEHLKNFLVDSPFSDGGSAESVGTIRDLREQLKKGDGLDKPVLIKVRGTLFPAALLTEGWWERRQLGAASLAIEWKNPLQRWLFKGFDLWAPSWDICWGHVDTKQAAKRYYIAQLTEGDEADSLPVIIGTEKAKRLADEFKDSWGGFEVVIVGMLGHRWQFEKKLPKNVKREPTDYYISVEDDKRRHTISRIPAGTDLYSGYLWKLLAPEEWMKGEQMLGLNQVYFVWEHTNFVAKEAVQYNLDALEHKEGLIAKQHPGSKLILLQKSHAIVPGDPKWTVDKFYDLYLGKGKQI
jgi:hypothetical protein